TSKQHYITSWRRRGLYTPCLCVERLQPFGDEFGDVLDDRPALDLGLGALEHLRAERTPDRDDLRAGALCFLEAFDVDGLRAVFLFLPELRATRAAAERILLGTRHLGLGDADGAENAAGLLNDIVVAAQIAWIVEGDVGAFGGVLRVERQLAGVDQLVDQFGVMDHFVFAAELVILLADVVIAVRAGDDDARRLGLVEGLDVGGRQFLIERLVTGAPRRRWKFRRRPRRRN